MIRYSVIMAILLGFCSACGQPPAQIPTPGPIDGTYILSSMRCNGSDPGSTLDALSQPPNIVIMTLSYGTETLIEDVSGCVVTSRGTLTYPSPTTSPGVNGTAILAPSGNYDCEPANCDSRCGHAVPTTALHYQYVFGSPNLDWVSTDDPICPNASDLDPAFFSYLKQ